MAIKRLYGDHLLLWVTLILITFVVAGCSEQSAFFQTPIPEVDQADLAKVSIDVTSMAFPTETITYTLSVSGIVHAYPDISLMPSIDPNTMYLPGTARIISSDTTSVVEDTWFEEGYTVNPGRVFRFSYQVQILDGVSSGENVSGGFLLAGMGSETVAVTAQTEIYAKHETALLAVTISPRQVPLESGSNPEEQTVIVKNPSNYVARNVVLFIKLPWLPEDENILLVTEVIAKADNAEEDRDSSNAISLTPIHLGVISGSLKYMDETTLYRWCVDPQGCDFDEQVFFGPVNIGDLPPNSRFTLTYEVVSSSHQQ